MARSNKLVVPQAREALDRFKMESANEVGVSLKQGYNGDLTSKQAGSIGGQMVNNILPERHMKTSRYIRTSLGHTTLVNYIYSVVM